jgi:hypothetical protein
MPNAKWLLISFGIVSVLLACPSPGRADVLEPKSGEWTFGGGIGFLGATPSGTAWALNARADNFLNRNFSVGPLMQVAFTGALTQIGISGQAKFWSVVPDTDNRLKIVGQAGLGFLHADRLNSDTSFLIPIGIGLDYAVSRSLALTADFLINFTDIDTGKGRDAHVMPGLTFGVRF